MKRHIVRTLFACAAILVTAPLAQANSVTICSSDFMLDWPNCDCGYKLPGKMPIAIFDFKNQAALKSTTGIHLTLTVQDGETSFGQLDYDKWSLGLGSVNTGLKLNGFTKDEVKTVTFDWVPGSVGWPGQEKMDKIAQEIIANNGLITATIIDSTPEDNEVRFYSAFQTSLCLIGEPVPEPTSILLWSTLAGCGALARRRSRRSK